MSDLKIFTDNIEPQALDQIYTLTKQPAFRDCKVRIMPDVHSGKGCVIGFTADLGDKVIPNIVGVDIGCVDKDTEFLSENGWIKISEYSNQKIAVFDTKERKTRFEYPVAYMKDKNEEFYHLHTKYGIDQMLSKEHKCLVEKGSHNRPASRGELYCISAKELYEKHMSLKLGFRDNFICDIPGLILDKKINLSDAEIRVQVMVMADGHIQNNGNCVCHFVKQRKIERCQKLLKNANIEYEIKNRKDGNFAILFTPPLKEKRMSAFWECSKEQLYIICEEVMKWDGTIKDNVYTSKYKEDVDFVQYAFAATGRRTSISFDSRERKESYRCIISDSKPRVQLAGTPKTDIDIVKSEDGHKYCFTTSTGYWIMRRNGCICVTGNCGMLTVELGKIDIDYAELDRVIRQYVPSGRNVHEEESGVAEEIINELYCKDKLREVKWLKCSLGSLGGGNHFIEIDEDSDGNKYLIIHTGSRNLGKQVAEIYQQMAIDDMQGANKLAEESKALIAEYKRTGRHKDIERGLVNLKRKWQPDKLNIPKELCYLTGEHREMYLHDMKLCQEFARINRRTIESIIGYYMNWPINRETVKFQTIHNYIDHDTNIVRKGAISAQKGEKVLIPINMRDGCIIGMGKGNEDWNCSAPHGAGRIMSRSKAKENIALEEFQKSMQGIYTTSVNQSTIDESPMAYKPIAEIVANIQDTVDIVKIIKPVYNFKASE